MRRFSIWLAIVAVAIVSGWAGFRFNASRYEQGNGAATGTIAQLLVATFQDLDGRPHTLGDWRGKILVVNFWATWCPPCKAEMPLMEQQYQQHRQAGLVILGVDLQESPAAVRAWTGDRFHWSFVIDSGGRLADLYNLEGVPSHVFIDRAGIVQSIRVGDLSATDMAADLARILPP